MADVKIIDIDSEQWNIKDQEARTKNEEQDVSISENATAISNLQSKTTGIFHLISQVQVQNGQQSDMIIPEGLSFILYSQYEAAGLNAAMYQVGRYYSATEKIYINSIVTASAITVTVVDNNHIRVKIATGYGNVLFRLFQLS